MSSRLLTAALKMWFVGTPLVYLRPQTGIPVMIAGGITLILAVITRMIEKSLTTED